MNTPGNCNLSQ